MMLTSVAQKKLKHVIRTEIARINETQERDIGEETWRVALAKMNDALDAVRALEVHAGDQHIGRTAVQMIRDLERMVSKLEGY